MPDDRGRPLRFGVDYDLGDPYVIAAHDPAMPHDQRYPADHPLHCPPNCPARPGLVQAYTAALTAGTWDGHGRPPAGVWWGWADSHGEVDQHLIGLAVLLGEREEEGQGLVLAEFAGGIRLKFRSDTRFRIGPTATEQHLVDEMARIREQLGAPAGAVLFVDAGPEQLPGLVAAADAYVAGLDEQAMQIGRPSPHPRRADDPPIYRELPPRPGEAAAWVPEQAWDAAVRPTLVQNAERELEAAGITRDDPVFSQALVVVVAVFAALPALRGERARTVAVDALSRLLLGQALPGKGAAAGAAGGRPIGRARGGANPDEPAERPVDVVDALGEGGGER